MRTLVILCLTFLSTGCSVYQNAGRKYLEKNSFEYAGIKLHDQTVGCAAPGDDAWDDGPSTDRARVRQRRGERGFELRIELEHAPASFACDYVFATELERTESTELAIDATLFARARATP